jgi:predicted nucleic acid-binding OB-fold protein
MKIMQQRDGNGGEEETRGPLDGEIALRILDIQDRRPIGHEVQCITEPSLYIVRARVSDTSEISVGSCIGIPSENIGVLSEVRLKDLSGSSQQELVGALSASISKDKDRHISFYNSAGPMSLKFHAFQLLPGIGNSKAIQMVKERGQAGWNSFEKVDESCGIESVRLLAERYVKEMEDVAQTPRLLDLLVRTEN